MPAEHSPAATTTHPPRAADPDAIVEAVGPKVRDIRQQLGWSLQQLAVRSDVSAAAIHKVERGDMVPTITTLLKIAGALDRPVSYFVDEDGQEEEPAWHTPAAHRLPVPTEQDGVELEAVGGPPERFRSSGTVVTVAAGASGVGRLRPRPAETLVFVLEGRLDFEVSGRSYVLRKGDTLHYPADRRHRWNNPGRKPARMLWFLSQEP